MPPKPFKLYTIEGLNYGDVIAEYRALCETGIKDFDDSGISVTGPSELKYIVKKKPRKPLLDDTRILNKAKYVVHTIAYRQQTDPEQSQEGASVSMSILQDVIGEDATELTLSLIKTGHITRSSVYQVGKFSRRYKALGTIVTEPCTNATIRKYIEHTKQILSVNVAKRLSSPDFTDEYGGTFADTYIKNLNKFKIIDRKGFESYASEQIKENPQTEAYYDFIRTSFEGKLRIYSIDANNRIYHILTSLKRELKQYVNIRFSIDCSNSHPLLFNYFIFINRQISPTTAYRISEALSNHKNLHILSEDHSHPTSNVYFVSNGAGSDATADKTLYDTGKLRNILISSGIDRSEIDRLKSDEILYIWKTSGGFFWDDVLRRHTGNALSRAEIKQTMFAQVFYSKTTEDVWKEYGREFKAEYPNVYDLILRWKAPLSNPDTKAVLLRRNKAVELGNRAWMKDETTALPNVMMDLESVIFRDILQALFRKRISAVHIHDAIVIPAVKGTANIDPEQICEVMRHAYRRFGLCPTLKVETY